jgi:hypothetical protein
VPMPQKPQALTRTLLRPTDADMVQLSQSQAMHREAAAADVAAEFVQRVVCRPLTDAHAEDTDAIDCRRPLQPNHTLRFRSAHALAATVFRSARCPS